MTKTVLVLSFFVLKGHFYGLFPASKTAII